MMDCDISDNGEIIHMEKGNEMIESLIAILTEKGCTLNTACFVLKETIKELPVRVKL